MKIRYRLVNAKNEIMFCNFKSNEIGLIEEINKKTLVIGSSKTGLRAGLISNEHGKAYGITEDRDYLNSARMFASALEVIANTLTTFENICTEYRDQINANTSRLLHNLTTLNAHNIQEIYSLVPQDTLSKIPASQQFTVVEKIVKDEPQDTAFALLRIAKNNAAMKTEFSVFNKLFDANPRLEKKSHNVHKVLMNVLYLFFPDFTDRNVYVDVVCPENTTAFFDYESVHVALYHLIENAVKYVKPGSALKINIVPSTEIVTIDFDMMSLPIKEKEKITIFHEGCSGEAAIKSKKAGNGIGMNRVKTILKINNANILVNTYPNTLIEFRGTLYQRNVFTITLNVKRLANETSIYA